MTLQISRWNQELYNVALLWPHVLEGKNGRLTILGEVIHFKIQQVMCCLSSERDDIPREKRCLWLRLNGYVMLRKRSGKRKHTDFINLSLCAEHKEYMRAHTETENLWPERSKIYIEDL